MSILRSFLDEAEIAYDATTIEPEPSDG